MGTSEKTIPWGDLGCNFWGKRGKAKYKLDTLPATGPETKNQSELYPTKGPPKVWPPRAELSPQTHTSVTQCLKTSASSNSLPQSNNINKTR